MELVTVSAEGTAAELEGVNDTRRNLVPSGTVGDLQRSGPRGITETASLKDSVCSIGKRPMIYEQREYLILDNTVLIASSMATVYFAVGGDVQITD